MTVHNIDGSKPDLRSAIIIGDDGISNIDLDALKAMGGSIIEDADGGITMEIKAPVDLADGAQLLAAGKDLNKQGSLVGEALGLTAQPIATHASMPSFVEAMQSQHLEQIDGSSTQVLTRLRDLIAQGEGGAPLGGGDFALTQEVVQILNFSKGMMGEKMPTAIKVKIENDAPFPELSGPNSKALTLALFEYAIKLSELNINYPGWSEDAPATESAG